MSLKVENWEGKRILIGRDEKGRIIARKKYKRATYQRDKDIYKRNKTFKEDVKRDEEILKKVIVISKLKKSSEKGRKRGVLLRGKDNAMYSVQGFLGKKKIVANSKLDVGTPSQKKKNAWESFLERISQSFGGGYDADEGLKYIEDVTNIKEGWVYYIKK